MFVAACTRVSPYPDDTAEWSAELGRFADWLGGLEGPVVVAGDFNATRDHHQFRDHPRRRVSPTPPARSAPAGCRPTPPTAGGSRCSSRSTTCSPATASWPPTSSGSSIADTDHAGARRAPRRPARRLTRRHAEAALGRVHDPSTAGPRPRHRRQRLRRRAPGPELLAAGWTVRAMARTATRLRDAPWAGDVEVAVADVTDRESLARALAGRRRRLLPRPLDRLGQPEFEDRTALAATTFAERAEAAGVAPHRLPRRPDAGGRGALAAPAQPGGGRAHPARQRRADRRAAGRRGDRQRQRQLRDAAPPHRAAAGDGRAEVGRHAGSSRSPSATSCATSSAPPTCRRTSTGRFDIGGPDVLTYGDMMRALRRRSPACRGGGC